MSIEFDNNASGTNSVQVEIADPTITLQTSEGALFPPVTTVSGDFFYATLEDTSGNIEIVKVTDNNTGTDVLTATRAQENTTAKQFVTGTKVELRTTAATFAEFIQRTGGTMTGLLDLNGNVLQDPSITSTGVGEILGLPLRGADAGTANQIVVPSSAGAPTIGLDVIWHAGNDGAGTGLDADTLDTLQATDFVQEADATVTFTGTVQLDDVVTTADFGTGGRVKDGNDTARPIGFNVMPAIDGAKADASSTLDLTSNGGLLHKDTTAAADYTLPNDGDIPQGATWTVACDAVLGANLFRVKGDTGVTVRWFDQISNTTTDVIAGNGFTLSDATVATIYKYTDTVYFLWGGGIIESV